MKCFRCQSEQLTTDSKSIGIGRKPFIEVNIGRDYPKKETGDIHLYICQDCCGKLVLFLKGKT